MDVSFRAEDKILAGWRKGSDMQKARITGLESCQSDDIDLASLQIYVVS